MVVDIHQMNRKQPPPDRTPSHQSTLPKRAAMIPPCFSNVVSRKLLERFRHVLGRRLPIGAANALWCMSCDCVVYALTDVVTLRNLLEGVTPSVVGLHFRVVDAYVTHPLRQ